MFAITLGVKGIQGLNHFILFDCDVADMHCSHLKIRLPQKLNQSSNLSGQ